jgi:hypothetical protein
VRSRSALILAARRALGATALTLLSCAAAPAQEQSLEYAVKATYLYKFAPFVEWPPGRSAGALDLCVAGDDPFGPLLERAVGGQRIGERPIALRRLDAAGSVEECDILYVAGSSEQSVAEALDAARGAPVLTVTDAAQGDARGIVHFVIRDNRVRFEIDSQAAAASGLKISSKLLDLAVNVRRRG